MCCFQFPMCLLWSKIYRWIIHSRESVDVRSYFVYHCFFSCFESFWIKKLLRDNNNNSHCSHEVLADVLFIFERRLFYQSLSLNKRWKKSNSDVLMHVSLFCAMKAESYIKIYGKSFRAENCFLLCLVTRLLTPRHSLYKRPSLLSTALSNNSTEICSVLEQPLEPFDNKLFATMRQKLKR